MSYLLVKMRRKEIAWTILVGLATLAGCGGGAELGEACPSAGATDETCKEGGVCGDDGAGTLLCLKICTDKSECSSGQDCNGIAGSNLKGCRTSKQ